MSTYVLDYSSPDGQRNSGDSADSGATDLSGGGNNAQHSPRGSSLLRDRPSVATNPSPRTVLSLLTSPISLIFRFELSTRLTTMLVFDEYENVFILIYHLFISTDTSCFQLFNALSRLFLALELNSFRLLDYLQFMLYSRHEWFLIIGNKLFTGFPYG